MSHPIRRVGLRDNLMMLGNHHMPAGRRHWRCDKGAFAITDYHGNPLVWAEGDQIVGEMAVTVAKPRYAGRGGEAVAPLANETLVWFEVVKIGGAPMVRTWWAKGTDIERTMKVARLEIIDPKKWQARFAELLKLMDWAS
jgi:hypothetical protein